MRYSFKLIFNIISDKIDRQLLSVVSRNFQPRHEISGTHGIKDQETYVLRTWHVRKVEIFYLAEIRGQAGGVLNTRVELFYQSLRTALSRNFA